MPNLDRTGPEGKGPLTGKQLGNCENARQAGRGFGPNGMGRGFRRGLGCGRGFGRGFRNSRPVVLSEAEEKIILEAELKEIDSEKQEIEKSLKEMK